MWHCSVRLIKRVQVISHRIVTLACVVVFWNGRMATFPQHTLKTHARELHKAREIPRKKM